MYTKRKDSKGRILRSGEDQRADGKYMFRYTDSSGKRHSVYSWKLVSTDKAPEGTRCTEALRDIEKRIRRDIEDGITAGVSEKISVDDMFHKFMEIRSDLKTTTRCNYKTLYDCHVRDTIGYRRIVDVKHSDVQKLYTDLSVEKGLCGSTIESIHSILYQVFECAVKDDVLRSNPVSNALKKIKRMCKNKGEKKRALTVEQQKRFVDYIYSSSQFAKYGPLFTTLLGTGMRIGEALGLRWRDCNFQERYITVDHTMLYKTSESGGYEYRISGTKTIAGMREIPMFSDVMTSLLSEKDRQEKMSYPVFEVDGYSGFIFINSHGRVYTPGAIFEVIQNIVNSYNTEEHFLAFSDKREPCYLPKISAHILRHTFCTRLCENESNLKVIQDVMGHKNIRTTMEVYNDATKDKKRVSFDSIDGKMKLM